MKKKVLALLLAATMVGSMMPMSFAAQGEGIKVLDEQTKTPTFLGGISNGMFTEEQPADEEPAAETRSIDFKTGDELSGKSKDFDGVASFFNSNQDLFQIEQEMDRFFEDFFQVENEFEDEFGNTVIRTNQVIDGVPVYGYDQVLTVDKNGKTQSYSGYVVPELDKIKKVNTKVKLSSDEALKAAEKDLGFTPNYDYTPSAEKYLYIDGKKPVMVYEVVMSFIDPEPGYWSYLIDAQNGKVVQKLNKIAHGSPVTGQGTGVNGDRVTLDTWEMQDWWYGTYYALFDGTRGNGILTYDASNSESLPGEVWYDNDNAYHTSYDGAAVDAHSHAAEVFDYYLNMHNRKSYDNNNARVKSTVHYGNNYNNAFWNGQQMVYGDGDGSTFVALSAGLDVVGHELTHAVTEKTANLIYQNESGALNEAMSDIFGTLIEYYQNDDPDWYLGEDIAGSNNSDGMMRNMKDPASISLPASYGGHYPDHYNDRYTGTNDNGGVHINSSIINKWAYLVAEGGTHYGTSVQGIGRDKLGKITYRALTVHMTQQTDFSDFRGIMIYTAQELYGSNSQEVQSVTAAFNAVGVQ